MISSRLSFIKRSDIKNKPDPVRNIFIHRNQIIKRGHCIGIVQYFLTKFSNLKFLAILSK